MPRRAKVANADSPYPPGWEPFLDAIRADVDDDTPRLVFADWLQENGDEERGELIRLQCTLQRAPGSDPDNAERNRRIEVLFHANWDRWTRGFPPWVRRDRFSHSFIRGFIAEVSMTAARFAKDGEAVTRLTALSTVNFSSTNVDVLRSPLLERIGGLYLGPVDSARVDALGSNPHLSAIRYLHIGTRSDSGGSRPKHSVNRTALGRLFANPSLVGLRQFLLKGPPHGDVVASGLAAGRFTALKQLDLVTSRLSAEGLKAVVRSASAGSLRGLYIAGNPIGDDGIRHMVEAPNLSRIQSLNLTNCGLTPESVRLLAEWPGLRTVRWLALSRNGFPIEDAELIRKSQYATALSDCHMR